MTTDKGKQGSRRHIISMFSIAVLIPCYNEAATIGKMVRDFKAELPEAEICVFGTLGDCHESRWNEARNYHFDAMLE